MDKNLKNIADNFEAMQIGLDDEFKFHCTQCGKCCIHREDILLNPKDIYNMSKELRLTPRDLIDRYCEIYIGPDSRVPIIRLKPRGTVKRCPLLKNRKCMVHKAKPVVCAMFPIGRCLVAEGVEKAVGIQDLGKIRYIFTHPDCGDSSETHTVRSWLGMFGIPVEDDFFLNWQEVVFEMCRVFREVEDRMSSRVIELLWTAAVSGLYLHYDIGQDFGPQFEENARKFLELLHMNFPGGRNN